MADPAIILVRPQLGENIGHAARAMLNFGLNDLRLVAPRDGWPNPDAGPPAAGADRVLDQARVYPTVEDACADCHFVYATTVRPRDMLKEVVTPAEAARRCRDTGAMTGFLFGAERSGLSNDEIARADTILTVPLNPEFSSLNLAQAVLLVGYEWWRTADQTPAARLVGDFHGPASKLDLDGLIVQLEDALTEKHYFFPVNRAATMRRTLRNILQKSRFSGQEVQTLRGVVKALSRPSRDD